MPRPRNRELKHCHHRASGRGYVRIDDVFHYTGPWGSREAEERYKILNGEFLARGGAAAPVENPAPPPFAGGITVGDLADLYVVRHVLTYYRGPDGRETGEVRNIAAAMRMLKAVWGSTPAAEFTPLRLEQLREALAQGRHRQPGDRGSGGLARTRINREAQRIKQLFAWAVRAELVRAEVYYALLSVKALKRFRGGARETEPVQPVDDATIARTLPFLTPTVRDMVLLQRLTGMRPGELVAMTTADIDRGKGNDGTGSGGAAWVYSPARHKTAHHGHVRAVPLVGDAQRILAPYLRDDEPGAFIFSPEVSRTQAKARRREAAKYTGRQAAAVGEGCGARAAGSAYTTWSYRRAVSRASLMAQMPAELSVAGRQDLTRGERAALKAKREAWLRENAGLAWHPHQIRHTVAKGGKRSAGLDQTRALLGHRSVAMTEHYAGVDLEAAVAGAVSVAAGARELVNRVHPPGPRLAM